MSAEVGKDLDIKELSGAYSIVHYCTEIEGLRYCATSRKVAVSVPDCVIGIFH